MKSIRRIIAGILACAGLAAFLNLLHAQVRTGPVQNAPLSLTAADMAQLPNLSDAELSAFLSALTAMPTITARDLPETASTFHSLAHPEWPPLPTSLGLPLWNLGSGFYLLNDLQRPILSGSGSGGMQAMSMDPNDPSDGSTDEYIPNWITPFFIPPTNALWLEITSVDMTNQLANILAHNTRESSFYQLLSKTNLIQPSWTLGDITSGDPGTNTTMFSSFNIGGNPKIFFYAHQADAYVILQGGSDAVEPNGTDPGQISTFYFNNYGGTNDITVHYSISGTASNGVDYANLSGVANVSAALGYGTVNIQALADNLIEGIETVTLTLEPGDDYLIHPSYRTATVQILDASTTVHLVPYVDLAIEPNGPPGVAARPASFTLYRSDSRGINTNSLAVNYSITGTASNGADYSTLSGTVTLLPGADSTNLDIIPLADYLPEGIETVTISLIPTNTYLIDASQNAGTALIDDSSTTVSISSPGAIAVEPGPSTNYPGQAGYFTISRSDERDIYTNLTVSYTISGTASNGLDYVTLSGTVTLLPDAHSTNIYVQPLADYLPEGDETVVLTLVPTSGFHIVTNHLTAMITIRDTGYFLTVATGLPSPTGIDYHAPLNSLVFSCSSGGTFKRIYNNVVVSNSVVMTNVVITNWSGISGLPDEVKVATPKATLGGFTNGDVFFSSSSGVGWISAAGSVSNLNWCVLTNSTVTNALPIRGGLYVDQSGVWSNNLIVVTSPGIASSGNKGIWRVNPNRQPTLITNINTLHLEGVIVLTNDVAKWGPWAGKIITGDEDSVGQNNNPRPLIYAISTNGTVTTYDTTNLISGGIYPEDFDIIPPNQDLYCCDENPPATSRTIAKISRNFFTNYVGDLLVTDELGSPSKLVIIHWNAATTNFTAIPIPFKYANGSFGEFEHVTFAPLDIPAN